MLYRIGAGWTASVGQMEQSLERSRFVACRPTQEKSTGWIPPRGERHGALVESVGGQLLLEYAIEDKLLPASVVRRIAAQKLEEVEASSGRKPGRKEARDMREKVRDELLPRAFTRQATVKVWIDPRDRLLVIDTTTQARLDEVLQGLVRSLDGFALAPLKTESSPQAAMAAWLLENEAPGAFDLDRECELKGTDDMQASVRYARHHLDMPEIRRHVEGGKMPTRLALTWEGKVGFVLTDAMQVKKIRFLDGEFRDAGTAEEDRFDADATIATGELRGMFAGLLKALGGEAREA